MGKNVQIALRPCPSSADELTMTPTLPRFALTLGLVALAGSLTSCAVPTVRAYGGYSEMQMSGSLALEPTLGGVSLGTITNNVEQLGIDDKFGSPYARVEVGLGLPRITVSAFQFKDEGTGQLQASFGNIVAGTTVRTLVDISSAKAALTFDFLDTITGGLVRLSPGLAANVMDVRMEVSDTLALVTEDVDELVAVPMPFVQLEVDAGMLAVTGEIGGMRLDLEEIDGEFLDAEVMVRLAPVDHFELFAGYRFISLDVSGTADDQDFDTDLRLSGWMVGGGVTF